MPTCVVNALGSFYAPATKVRFLALATQPPSACPLRVKNGNAQVEEISSAVPPKRAVETWAPLPKFLSCSRTSRIPGFGARQRVSIRIQEGQKPEHDLQLAGFAVAIVVEF